MTIRNVIIFGKDPDNEAQIIGVTGSENDAIKITSIETEDKLLQILKELKKLSLYLSLTTDKYIRNEDIGD